MKNEKTLNLNKKCINKCDLFKELMKVNRVLIDIK